MCVPTPCRCCLPPPESPRRSEKCHRVASKSFCHHRQAATTDASAGIDASSRCLSAVCQQHWRQHHFLPPFFFFAPWPLVFHSYQPHEKPSTRRGWSFVPSFCLDPPQSLPLQPPTSAGRSRSLSPVDRKKPRSPHSAASSPRPRTSWLWWTGEPRGGQPCLRPRRRGRASSGSG